jgi:hypothetical protein
LDECSADPELHREYIGAPMLSPTIGGNQFPCLGGRDCLLACAQVSALDVGGHNERERIARLLRATSCDRDSRYRDGVGDDRRATGFLRFPFLTRAASG